MFRYWDFSHSAKHSILFEIVFFYHFAQSILTPPTERFSSEPSTKTSDDSKFATEACENWNKFFKQPDAKCPLSQIITLGIAIIWQLAVQLYILFLFGIVKNR